MTLRTKLPPFFFQLSKKLVLALVFFLILWFIIGAFAPTTGPFTIDTSPRLAAGLSFNAEHKSGYAQGRHWVVYLKSGSCEGSSVSCLFIASSVDGTSWLSVALNRRAAAFGYSVLLNNTHVFITRYNQTDTSVGGFGLIFGYAVVNSDGTITGYTESVVKQPGASTLRYQNVEVGLSSTFQVFIGYQYDDSAGVSDLPYVIRSSGVDYTFWTEDTLLSNTDHDWKFAFTSITNGQIYISYYRSSDAFGRLWNNGWGVEENIDVGDTGGTIDSLFLFSTGTVITTIYYGSGPTPDIILYRLRGETGWSATSETITSNIVNTLFWTATYDSLQNEYYIFDYSTANNRIDEYRGKSQSWGGATQVFTTTGANTSMTISAYRSSGSINSTTSVIGIFWTENDSPTTNVEIKMGIEWITAQVSGPGGTGSGGPSGPGPGAPGGFIAVPDVPWEPFAALWIVQSGFILIPHINRRKRQRGNILEKI